MESLVKVLILGGVTLILIGFLFQIGGRFFMLGRLPGDIAFEKGNFKFYFPLTTSLILSITLTLFLFIVRWFRN